MNTNNLIVGNYYTLKYIKPWHEFDVKDVKISSITVESETAQYGVDSLFSDYFAKYNLTISKFAELMSTVSSDVYVCQAVLDKSIGEVDDNLTLIPKIMIDFPNSEQLLMCDNILITVGGLVKNHELAYDRGLYYSNLVKNVKNALRTLEQFGDTIANVNISTTDILKTITEYNRYNDFRSYTYNIQKLATEQEILKHNKDLKAMIDKSNELNTSIANYNANVVDLEESIANFTVSKAAYEEASNTVRTTGISLFAGLENGSILPNSVEYFTYRNIIMDAVAE